MRLSFLEIKKETKDWLELFIKVIYFFYLSKSKLEFF